MYVRRVTLENIRPFRKLSFDFERPGVEPGAASSDNYRGWNVIAGDNASGKSTLLRALALGIVGPDIARALAPSLAGWVRQGADKGRISVEIAFDEGDVFRGGGNRPKEPFTAELVLQRFGGDVALTPGTMRLMAAKNGPWATDQGHWFCLAYGPFRRLSGHSPDASRLMAVPGRPPRFGTLFREDATLSEATAWLQDLQFKALENRRAEAELLAAVKGLLNDDFLQQGFAIERVDSDGLWLRDPAGTLLALAEMSDGYRSALALLIDMVRHMASAYGPSGLVEDRDGRKVVPHPGVVLIDEVDSHLHPSWQRRIGDWLKERFPSVQFITTSHSPFVVQACDPGGLYRLSDPTSLEPAYRVPEEERLQIVRRTTDGILTSAAFGLEYTRSAAAVQERNEFSRLRSRARQRAPLSEVEAARLQQMSLFYAEE